MSDQESLQHTIVLNVTPSLRTRTCNTDTSKQLGQDLLEAAEEHHAQIPDGLYLKLCNLAKVQHSCVCPEELHDAKAAIHVLMMDLSNQYMEVSNKNHIIDMLKNTAQKRDDLIEALQGALDAAKSSLETVRASSSIPPFQFLELDDKNKARPISTKRARK